MMINKIILFVDYKNWLKHLDTQINSPTIKVPKVVKQTNNKLNYKTLETSVINRPMSYPFLRKPLFDLLVPTVAVSSA